MIRSLIFALVWIGTPLLLCAGGFSAPIFGAEPTNDASGTDICEIYGVGYEIEGGMLRFLIRTNFPEEGLCDSRYRDSYARGVRFEPGDLFLFIGGEVFALAFTSHANVVTQAYSDVWKPVERGHLYYLGTVNAPGEKQPYATATYERYERAKPSAYPPDDVFAPDEVDLNYSAKKGPPVNSYPTFIRDYLSDLGAVSFDGWREIGSSPRYEIWGGIPLSLLGHPGEGFRMFWSMECGNDGAVVEGTLPTPEPLTISLLGGGVALLLAASRRRRG